VRAVRNPSGARKRSVTPLAPETVEEMRHWLLRRNLIRDATLVSVLAYAGLRPGAQAFALTRGLVRERTLLVEAAVSLGQITETKTRLRRTVRMLAPLSQDLAEWRLHCGRPDAGVLVFPGHDGWPWSAAAWKNWRRRAFGHAASAAGVPDARPYDLRHSFVSLLIAEGCNILEVARQAGHSPTMWTVTITGRRSPRCSNRRGRPSAAPRAPRLGVCRYGRRGYRNLRATCLLSVLRLSIGSSDRGRGGSSSCRPIGGRAGSSC
jgi:integrase